MLRVTGSSSIVSLLMVPVSLEQRGEVVEKLKQLISARYIVCIALTL